MVNLQENVTEQTTEHAGAIIGFQTHKGEQVHASCFFFHQF